MMDLNEIGYWRIVEEEMRGAGKVNRGSGGGAAAEVEKELMAGSTANLTFKRRAVLPWPSRSYQAPQPCMGYSVPGQH